MKHGQDTELRSQLNPRLDGLLYVRRMLVVFQVKGTLAFTTGRSGPRTNQTIDSGTVSNTILDFFSAWGFTFLSIWGSV